MSREIKFRGWDSEYLGEMDIENMCIKIIGNIYENPELLRGEK